MHLLKDISMIIPTYNRAKNLKAALRSLKGFIKHLNEIIIVDQSTNKETKNLKKS